MTKQHLLPPHFFRILLTIALPIILQNLMQSLVNMLDTVMGGAAGFRGHCRRGAGKPNLFSIEHGALWHFLRGGNLCGPVLGKKRYSWNSVNLGACLDLGYWRGCTLYRGSCCCSLFFDWTLLKGFRRGGVGQPVLLLRPSCPHLRLTGKAGKEIPCRLRRLSVSPFCVVRNSPHLNIEVLIFFCSNHAVLPWHPGLYPLFDRLSCLF